MTGDLVERLTKELAEILAEPELVGAEWCRKWSGRVDRWLVDLFGRVVAEPDGLALVAVGGYGRSELSPHSDLDLVLLHDGRPDIAELADLIWYPIWDTGLKVGHAVRTNREAVALAAEDLDTATSMLSVRHLAGDKVLSAELAGRALAQWQRLSKKWLTRLSEAVEARHAASGEVAFLLEPELKEGRGGLRDVHALRWAEAAGRVLLPGDDANVQAAYDLLLSVRVELHRQTRRPGDRLLLQEQDGVAAVLADGDADSLMGSVAAAARTIAWTSDETWDRVRSGLRGPLGRRASRDRRLAEGVVLRDGLVHLASDADPATDPVLVLRVAEAAATLDTAIERQTLDRLAASTPPFPDPWPDDAKDLLVKVLCTGVAAIGRLEALDQRGLLVRMLPEWEPVRSRPQRNAYHRFTVDRHLWEAAAEASALVHRVERPDLLVIGALLHDIGKGYPGDHTEVGVELIGTIGRRMGFSPEDVAMLEMLVRLHLLLPDVATRRDLSDDGTIRRVADEVGSLDNLGLLAALTEADSIATGPAAWGPWKAELVSELVGRVEHALSGGSVTEVAGNGFPSDHHLALMARGELVLEGADHTLLVVAPDRPGVFSRVAGVLALSGLDILAASAYSADRMALETFTVESTLGPTIAWDQVTADLHKALEGRLAVDARLAERARTYGPPAPAAAGPTEPSVVIDNEMSSSATVIEVHAADAIGVLYRITRALAELDLDIRSAKVQTLGHEVVDAFYVVDAAGGKITDQSHLRELERALLHSL